MRVDCSVYLKVWFGNDVRANEEITNPCRQLCADYVWLVWKAGHGMGNFRTPYPAHSFHTIATFCQTIFDISLLITTQLPNISNNVLLSMCIIFTALTFWLFWMKLPFKQPWGTNSIPNFSVSYVAGVGCLISEDGTWNIYGIIWGSQQTLMTCNASVALQRIASSDM